MPVMGMDPASGRPNNNIDAYVNFLRAGNGWGLSGADQFRSAAFLQGTDEATLMNDVASLYNTYGPPNGQYNAFAPDANGNYQDPTAQLGSDTVNAFIKWRDAFRTQLNQNGNPYAQQFKPYVDALDALGSSPWRYPGQSTPPKQVPTPAPGATTPAYNPWNREDQPSSQFTPYTGPLYQTHDRVRALPA